jgi:hypothetical protein
MAFVGHVHPPIDFPVYGLDDSWAGPRWLAFVHGEVGKPLWGVDLLHGWSMFPTPDRPWVQVTTFPWPRFAAIMGAPGESPDHLLAWHAMFHLTDRTMPNLRDKRLAEMRRRMHTVINDRADNPEAWSNVSIHVGERSVAGKITCWAGAWTAVVTDLPDVACLLLASEVAPESLTLRQLTDGEDYHFDLAQPIRFGETLHASAEAALGPASGWEDDEPSWPEHADHEELLGRS